jgi:hypothetical protein
MLTRRSDGSGTLQAKNFLFLFLPAFHGVGFFAGIFKL